MTRVERSDLSDIRPGDWVDRHLATGLRPYARLARIDRPVGVWLTLFPCFAALIQASGGIPPVRLLAVFGLGALVMRSAGSTINDVADRRFDAHVERTRFRPLAAGTVTTRGAVLFFVIQLLVAASLLAFLSPPTRWLAICVVPLTILYPFCKRVTYWPQAVLGAAFNWGMLMAWSEVAGRVPPGAFLMWLGAVFWQIGYDTIYGYVDAQDDARLGLRSTARLFAGRGRTMIGIFYAGAVLAWSIGGWLVGQSWPYQVAVAFIAGQLGWQVFRFDLERPELNFRMFMANIATGGMLMLAALLGTIG